MYLSLHSARFSGNHLYHQIFGILAGPFDRVAGKERPHGERREGFVAAPASNWVQSVGN